MDGMVYETTAPKRIREKNAKKLAQDNLFPYPSSMLLKELVLRNKFGLMVALFVIENALLVTWIFKK